MPNLVRKFVSAPYSVIAIALTGFPAHAGVHQFIPVESPPESGHWSFQIAAETTSTILAIWQSDGEGQPIWIASLSDNGQTWRATDTDCESFKAALYSFATLPVLRPGPLELQQRELGIFDMPNRRTEAPTWRIRLPAYAPDWTVVRMEIEDAQGPYAGWINTAVAAIKECSIR